MGSIAGSIIGIVAPSIYITMAHDQARRRLIIASRWRETSRVRQAK